MESANWKNVSVVLYCRLRDFAAEVETVETAMAAVLMAWSRQPSARRPKHRPGGIGSEATIMLIKARDDNLLRSYLEFLPKLGSYLIGLGLLCYSLGFIVSDIYLASLGTLNFEVIRTRYILVGILFSLFSGAVFYLLYGLWRVLWLNRWEDSLKLVWKAISYSLQNIAVLYFVVMVVSLLAGSVRIHPVGVPGVSSAAPWSDWLASAPAEILEKTAVVLGSTVLGLTLLAILLVVINPKDKYGMRKTRRERVRDSAAALREKGATLVRGLGGILLFLLVWCTSTSFLSFLGSNTTSGSSITPGFWAGGADRFLAGIICIYALFGSWLVMTFMSHRHSAEDYGQDLQDNPLAVSSTYIWMISFAIAIIVPVYALGIYPSIPQQIGGGQVLRVSVTMSSDELDSSFQFYQKEVYLVDRASTATMFLVVNRNTKAVNVIEISNTLIQSITYDLFP